MQTLSSTSAPAPSTVAQTQNAEPGRPPVFYVVTLLLISGFIYIGNAFYPALLDDADASHAVVAREMLQRGDWVVTYMNGIRYLMKAPLHYWSVAASYVLFGQTEFAVRLPVALAMVLLTLMTFEFGRRFFGLRAGFYSGLITATSVGMFLFTRIMIPEAIYALQFTATFYLFLRAWTGSMNKRLAYWGVAVLIALAVLTRGLIGIVFPLFTIAGFIIATKSWNRWRELHLFSSTLIFAAIAVPWHV
ncbi:MAG: ArnT family glycosyltransferase, partial [Candidatus Angelobacter sp.]